MAILHQARTAIGALALLAWPALAQAHIGDDLMQLRGHFGSAKDMGSQLLFQHDGYSICVYFDGDYAAMEVFVRDGSKPGKTDITREDIDQILQAEGDGQQWNSFQSNSGKPTWLRADGKVLARLSVGDDPGDKYFTIMVNAK